MADEKWPVSLSIFRPSLNIDWLKFRAPWTSTGHDQSRVTIWVFSVADREVGLLKSRPIQIATLQFHTN